MLMMLLIMYILFRMMFRYSYGRYVYRPFPRPMFLFGPYDRRPMMRGPRPMGPGPGPRGPMHGPHPGHRF